MSHTPITQALVQTLADTYALYLKTQNYHWNVTGPNFHSLHQMFESQYTELATAVDEIAERIRSLGEKAPGSFSEFSQLTQLKEANSNSDHMAMVKTLYEDHVLLAKNIHQFFEDHRDHCDEATQDLMTRRENDHQKTAWMLKATLGQ